MKAILKLVFLTLATSTVLLACAKSGSNGQAGYPGYPGYPGQPGYCAPGTYCPQGYVQPTFYGNTQVVNSGAYQSFIYGDLCLGKQKVLFWNVDTCKYVSGAPYVELVLPDLTLTNNYSQAQLRFYSQPRNHNNLYGAGNAGVQVKTVQLRRINNNTGFEGNFIDSYAGNGRGGLVQIRGTGLPAAADSAPTLSIEVLYNGSPMLRAQMVRVQ